MAVFRSILWILIAAFAALLVWNGFNWYRGTELASKPLTVPYPLVDQNGRAVTEATFRGKPAAVFFGYTHCPDVCPTTLYELDGWLKKADPDGTALNAFFVTIDPERDTPTLMKDYVTAVSKRIVGVSGEPKNVEAMARDFGVYFKKVPIDDDDPAAGYLMDHSASVYLIDAKGDFRSSIAFGENGDTAVTKLVNMTRRSAAN